MKEKLHTLVDLNDLSTKFLSGHCFFGLDEYCTDCLSQFVDGAFRGGVDKKIDSISNKIQVLIKKSNNSSDRRTKSFYDRVWSQISPQT